MRCLFLLFVICFCLCASFTRAEGGAEESSVSKTESETSSTVQKPLIPLRRKYIRKRLLNLNGDGSRNYSTSVSVSVSKSSSSPSRIFTRVNRPKLIIHKNGEGGASSTTLQVGGTQESVVETPNSSFRQKRPNRPLVKATLRKLYRPSIRTVQDNELKNEVSTTTTTTTASTTVAPSTETTTSTTTTLEPQTTTPTTTTTESSTTTTEESLSTTIVTEAPKNVAKTTPKNMIIIPVPPSQRRPYHPVIMQVTKSPGVTSTEKPQTRVVTYKLNKMFVPMGIYGKVLPKSEVEAANAAANAASSNDEVQVQEQEQQQQDATQTLSSGITAEIRHKGTSSEELITSESQVEGTAVNHPSSIPLTADDAIFPETNWRPFDPSARKQKNKQSKQYFDASQVDLTTNYKPDISKISLTTQKPQIDQISLTSTGMPSFFGPVSGNGNRRGNYQNQMTHMGPPKPFEKANNAPPKSMMESIKNAAANAASSIPGFLHGGLTHLSQMNLPNPLEEVFFGSSSEKTGDSTGSASSVISSIFNPTANTGDNKKVTIGAPDDETLEYFRKRPHLINKSHFSAPSSYNSGFKPSVSVKPSFAKAYFASTTTTPSPSTTASSYRKEKEYESNRASLLLRSPKNYQDAWKKEKSESYVDQLIESSNRYKYTATPSTFESDIIKSHWNTMNEKYTKNEIDEAKQRIYDMFSGPTPPNLEQMLYMQPPGESHGSRSSPSSSAFQDLLKMFRLGFSFGSSSSSSTRKPYTRSFGVGNLRTSASSSNEDADGWRPIKSGSGGSGSSDSIVSFNAQISIGSTPKPTALYPGHGGTHYSSSSKPYNPKPTSVYGLKSSGSHSSGSYSNTTPSSLRNNNHYRGSSSYSSHSSPSHSSKYPGPPPSSSGEYSDVYYSGGSMGENGETYREKEEDSYKPPSSLSSLYESDPGLELIPSNLFMKQREQGIDVGEIAAVLKPSGMNEDVVRAQLPQEDVAHVPHISYPNDKPNAVSQIQQYFQQSEPAPQNSVHFQPPLLRLIQQTMESQREQLGQHKHTGLLLNHPLSQSLKVPSQIQEEEEQPVAPLPLATPSSASSNSHHHNQYYSAEQSQPQPTHQHQHQQQQQQQLPQQFTLSQLGQLGFSGLGLSGLNTGHRFQINQDLLQQYRQQQQSSIEQQQQQQQQQIQHHHHHVQQQQPQIQQHHHQVQQPQIQHHHHIQQQQQPQQVQQHQHQHYAQQQQQVPGSVSLKTTGDSGLGFTDFELPAGVDPDIAALLKAELDKDDIPEEFRKEFQEQEKAKAKKQQQAAASAPVPVRVPKPKVTSSASRRQDVQIKTIFHKPIPISPTLITPYKGRSPSRPPPNIPKYVLDLAKKLRTDKDLQGIVRVTAKKSNGVPIEYLYPVRG